MGGPTQPRVEGRREIRTVSGILEAQRPREATGFPVRRPFPGPTLPAVDPFLLLDQIGPVTFGPGEAVGTTEHPARGFEVVTYLLEGRLRHVDADGRTGHLEPGDLLWTTAGAGLVHAEKPDDLLRREGGRLLGVQLWVNLPRREKMIPPRHQHLHSDQIPTLDGPGFLVHVLAGEFDGRRSPVETHTPVTLLHCVLQPGRSLVLPAPRALSTLAWLIRGAGSFGPYGQTRRGTAEQLVLFAQDGDQVAFSAPPGTANPLELLLASGLPLHEPVSRYGPFVMSTSEEIRQAIRDYQSGRLGRPQPR